MTFSAGSVLGRAFSVVLKNFVPFFVIGLVIVVPVTVLQHLLDPTMGRGSVETVATDGRVSAKASFGAAQIASSILGMVANYVLTGALVYATFLGLKGQRVSVGACLSRGLARFLPILLVSIVAGIGIGIGFVLLIVPGIILACMWYVAVPATTVERTGVFDSLRRSSDLTKGHRGSIFALFLLIFVLVILVTMVFFGILMGLGEVVGLILVTLFNIVIGLVGAALQAVAYHDLRAVKEGTSTDDLLKVFA